MIVHAIATHRVTATDRDLMAILDTYLPSFEERSVLVVTSKIAAITQGRLVPVEQADKLDLIREEAEYYLPPDENRYHVALTIKNSAVIPNAGIDESNGNGHYILWPEQPYTVANEVCAYLRARFSRRDVGVVITDSHTTPLRWGVTGFAIAYSGFDPLKNYVGETDIFGRRLVYTKVNVADALAASAVLVMGEGNEQTPLAVVSDLDFVAFWDRATPPQDVQEMRIDLDTDLYGPLLKRVTWRIGGAYQATGRSRE